ncbi:MAG: amidohydrolase [Chloroflexi bacterium]|nr:amidohydrolase [Chloroflexota bacterium]
MKKLRDYTVIDCHNYFLPPGSFGELTAAAGEKPVRGFTGALDDFLASMERDSVRQAFNLAFFPTGALRDAALAALPAGLPDYHSAAAGIERELVRRIQAVNAWVCESSPEHPEIVPFITVDPIMSETEIRAEITTGARKGAGGLNLDPGLGRYYPCDRRLWPAYRTAQELELPVMARSHLIPGGTQYSEPKYYTDVLASFPDLRLVLAHSGIPFWEQVRSLARSFDNVYFEVSLTLDPLMKGSLSSEEFVALYREIGMERAVFGSGFPRHLRSPALKRVAALDLNETAKKALLGENAVRIFRLT